MDWVFRVLDLARQGLGMVVRALVLFMDRWVTARLGGKSKHDWWSGCFLYVVLALVILWPEHVDSKLRMRILFLGSESQRLTVFTVVFSFYS